MDARGQKIADHAVASHTADVAFQCLAHQVERCKAIGERRQALGHHGIFEDGDRGCVGGGVVGESTAAWIELEDAEKIAPVSVIADIPSIAGAWG